MSFMLKYFIFDANVGKKDSLTTMNMKKKCIKTFFFVM